MVGGCGGKVSLPIVTAVDGVVVHIVVSMQSKFQHTCIAVGTHEYNIGIYIVFAIRVQESIYQTLAELGKRILPVDAVVVQSVPQFVCFVKVVEESGNVSVTNQIPGIFFGHGRDSAGTGALLVH